MIIIMFSTFTSLFTYLCSTQYTTFYDMTGSKSRAHLFIRRWRKVVKESRNNFLPFHELLRYDVINILT